MVRSNSITNFFSFFSLLIQIMIWFFSGTVPSAAPEDVQAGMVNATTAYIQWTAPPPQHINGALLGYKVCYRCYRRRIVLYLLIDWPFFFFPRYKWKITTPQRPPYKNFWTRRQRRFCSTWRWVVVLRPASRRTPGAGMDPTALQWRSSWIQRIRPERIHRQQTATLWSSYCWRLCCSCWRAWSSLSCTWNVNKTRASSWDTLTVYICNLLTFHWVGSLNIHWNFSFFFCSYYR